MSSPAQSSSQGQRNVEVFVTSVILAVFIGIAIWTTVLAFGVLRERAERNALPEEDASSVIVWTRPAVT
ncbi:MAG: hypothetical protein AAFV01_08855 [Bacteroidota bacterium]